MKRKVTPRACTFSLSWEDVAIEGHLALTVILRENYVQHLSSKKCSSGRYRFPQDKMCCMEWQSRISPYWNFSYIFPSRILSYVIAECIASSSLMHSRIALQIIVQGHRFEAKFGPASCPSLWPGRAWSIYNFCAPSGHCLAVRQPSSVIAASLVRSGCAVTEMSIRKDPMCDTSRGLVASKEHVVHCFDVLSSHFSGCAVPEPQFDNLHW